MNYIYGTALVLRGLEAIGMDLHEPMRAAGRGVAAHGPELRRRLGRESGGRTTMPNLRGQGGAPASQTAWAMLGLMAAGDMRCEFAARGIAYLLGASRRRMAAWREVPYTGTGFRGCST